jgi:hypothetical protein
VQVLGQSWGQFRFPLPYRLVAKDDAADQKHLGENRAGSVVAQAPEHHERDDLTRILRPVQRASAALVESLAALAAAEPRQP